MYKEKKDGRKKIEKLQSYEQRKWQYWLPMLKKIFSYNQFCVMLIDKVLIVIILNYKKNRKIQFFSQPKITNVATGGRVKVDKHFWRVNLGQNWRSSLRSTENDLGLKVDIEDRASGRQKMTRVLRSTLRIEL